nr:hypothetical protein DA06_26010 [Georgenia sp. SUBG003]
MMPSKLTSTSSRSLIGATIGCVEGSWSWLYAQDFSSEENVVHALVQRVARPWPGGRRTPRTTR